jgi:hypothetical protein
MIKNSEDLEKDSNELMQLLKSIYQMELNGTLHEDMSNDIYSHSFKYIYSELNGKEACLEYCDGGSIEDFGKDELIEIMYKASNRKKEILEVIKTIINTCMYADRYMDYFEAIKESGLVTKNVEMIEDILDVLEEDASQLKNYPQYQDNKQVLLTAIESWSQINK